MLIQIGGYTIPSPGPDGSVPHPRSRWGGYPIPGQGVPHPRSRSRWGGYPIPGKDGVPHPWPGEYPSLARVPTIQTWLGYPHLDLAGVPPCLHLAGVPPPDLAGILPVQTWSGYPPPIWTWPGFPLHLNMASIPPVWNWPGYPPVDRQMDGQTRVKTLPSRRTTYYVVLRNNAR